MKKVIGPNILFGLSQEFKYFQTTHGTAQTCITLPKERMKVAAGGCWSNLQLVKVLPSCVLRDACLSPTSQPKEFLLFQMLLVVQRDISMLCFDVEKLVATSKHLKSHSLIVGDGFNNSTLFFSVKTTASLSMVNNNGNILLVDFLPLLESM